MNRKTVLFGLFIGFAIGVGAIIVVELTPVGSLGVGDSMEPTIQHCSYSINQPDIFVSSYNEQDIVGYTSDSTGSFIMHRIFTKEKSFTLTSGQIQYHDGYIITSSQEENPYVTGEKSVDSYVQSVNGDTFYAYKPVHSEKELEAMEGETVYLLQGDGNVPESYSRSSAASIDNELITESQIRKKYVFDINLPNNMCEDMSYPQYR
jgi:hypothetical protein